MASTTEQRESKSKSWDVGELRPLPSSPAIPRRSGSRGIVVLGVVILGLVVVVMGSTRFSSWVGADEQDHAIIHVVTRGDLKLTITEDGEIQSASNMDVRCEVAGGSTILWIIEDGKQVQKGMEIVRLDSSTLSDELNAQRIVYERARAVMIQAVEGFAAAKLAVQEYVEGIYIQELQILDANITIAMENLRSSENSLQYTKRMARKGYVTPLQLEAQQFAVERSNLELDAAQSARRVLTEFTRKKMTRELESARDAAQAAAGAERAAFDLEQGRLKRLEGQLEKCVIYAPQDGMVVYANDSSRRRSNDTNVIEEGAAVRDQQVLIRLPDLSQMQAKVAVHESKIESLRLGMQAEIRIQDREVEGSITSVATQPEPTGWFSPNLKEYATIVKIEGNPVGLKPGMTAEVTIEVAHLKNVLTVPVQCVVELGDAFYCWVKTSSGPERRPIILGASNNKLIEIKDGVVQREEVLLNPRALVPEARQEGTTSGEQDADSPAEENKLEPSAPSSSEKPRQTKSDTEPSPNASAQDTAGGS